MTDVNEALEAYVEAFGENFPIFMVHMSEEKLLQTIQSCLRAGKKYSVTDPDKNNMY